MRLTLVPGVTILGVALVTVVTARSDFLDAGLPVVQPGLGVMIRADVLKRDLAQCFRRIVPVNARAEEGEVYSLLQVAARAHLEPVFDPSRAALNLVVYGNLIGNSIRSVENVRAYTRERSSFNIGVELFVDPRCISMGNVAVSVPITSELIDIRTSPPAALEPLIQSLGEVYFDRNKQRDDLRITLEGETRLRKQIYKQAREPLHQANLRYKREFLDRLAEYGIGCDDLAFSSNPDAVWLTARFKNLYLPPPPPVPDSPLVVQVHPGMFNRLANDRLAGKSYKEEDMEKLSSDLSRYIDLPRLEKREDRPLQVKMAAKDPLTLRIEGDTLIFTLSGESYTVGEDTYPGINVSARYQIVRKGDGWHLVRDEELEVLPPDFQPGMRLGARQQVLRTILRRRLGRLLPQDIPIRDIALDPIALGDLGGQAGLSLTISGMIHIDQINTDLGWLSIGLCLKLDRRGNHE